MNIGFEYIKYRWNAKGRHGIHSPFVFDLVDKCLKIQFKKEDKEELNDLFAAHKTDSRSIEVKDFGAGSKKLSKLRAIPTIFKTSSSKGKYGKLLYQLAQYHQFENILEFGTSLGIGTCYLQLGSPKAEITTVEACSNTREIALESFKLLELKNIESIRSTFDEFLQQKPSTKYDLIYIDGHHDGDALILYMKNLQGNKHDETIFILDDIRWSNSMYKAWNEIVASDDYHVTLDFFRFGVAVPRKHQVKEHFTLKL
ncbi:MAG: class I SAM-dependent methyltransferase [Crocinitomicaceae bacterium]